MDRAERTKLEQEAGAKLVAKHKRTDIMHNLPGVKFGYPGGGMVEVKVAVGGYSHIYREDVHVFPSEELFTKVMLLAG